jgi:hypothetical protein
LDTPQPENPLPKNNALLCFWRKYCPVEKENKEKSHVWLTREREKERERERERKRERKERKKERREKEKTV